MITPEQRKKLEKLAMDACVYRGLDGEPTFDEFVHKKFLEGAEALDRLLSTESACVTGCKNFTGGEIRHHKDCAHYPESFSKMYDELETRIQSEPDFDESDFIGRSPFEDTRLEEERKWRPLVGEMLEAIRSYEDKADRVVCDREIIARAEKLLSGAKDGKEE